MGDIIYERFILDVLIYFILLWNLILFDCINIIEMIPLRQNTWNTYYLTECISQEILFINKDFQNKIELLSPYLIV